MMATKNSTLSLLGFIALALAGLYVMPVEKSWLDDIPMEFANQAAEPAPSQDLAVEITDLAGTPLQEDQVLNHETAKAGLQIHVDQLQSETAVGVLQLKTPDGILITQSKTAALKDLTPWKVDVIRLLPQGRSSFHVVCHFTEGATKKDDLQTKEPTEVILDTNGPMIDSMQVSGTPESDQSLIVRFREADLMRETVNEHTFQVYELDATGKPLPSTINTSAPTLESDGRTVTVPLGRLHGVEHRLVVVGKPSSTSNGAGTGESDTSALALTDTNGNRAGGGSGQDQSRDFFPVIARPRGEAVEFPPFLPAEKPVLATRPNPGDRVETRVARLYYFRDAHRVAQIVNRITESYNRAAVTQAQRRAEDARKKAEELTDDRRAKERAAIEAAQSTRRAERELQQTYLEIRKLTQQRDQLARQTSQSGAVTGALLESAVVLQVTIADVEFETKSTTPQGESATPPPSESSKPSTAPAEKTPPTEEPTPKPQTPPGSGEVSSSAARARQTPNYSYLTRATLPAGRVRQANFEAEDLPPPTPSKSPTPDKKKPKTIQNRKNKNGQPETDEDDENSESDNVEGSLSSSPETTQASNQKIVSGTIVTGKISSASVASGSFNGTLLTAQQTILAGKLTAGQVTGGMFNGTIQNGTAVGTLRNAKVASARVDEAQLDQRPDISNLTTTLNRLNSQVSRLESDIAARRTQELKVAEESKQAQAVEDRAIEDQFRQEVAAAHEDPDTYAPAKKNSIDPVAQVSISVIGEGLIHLRGPIHGINTIRRMIDQIDTPVGQVKVGIHTVQINGEKGEKMEKVAGDVEGNIDLARFLTAQSLAMLRKAIQIEAAQVAEAAEQGGHLQVDRDRKYLYSFFGRDFIDELYEMDSEFLRSENKLLSLHSMDTINLNQALFVLALAKNDIRQRILGRFMEMVRSDLPQAEWDFRRSNELPPHRTRPWLPMADRTHLEQHTLAGVYRNAQQRYHFRSMLGFFDADSVPCAPDGTPLGNGGMAPDTMNSTQRTFLRLAQIFKSQMIAEQEVKQRIIERAIIEDNREDSFREEDELRKERRRRALESRKAADAALDLASEAAASAFADCDRQLAASMQQTQTLQRIAGKLQAVIEEEFARNIANLKSTREDAVRLRTYSATFRALDAHQETLLKRAEELDRVVPTTEETQYFRHNLQKSVAKTRQLRDACDTSIKSKSSDLDSLSNFQLSVITSFEQLNGYATKGNEALEEIWRRYERFRAAAIPQKSEKLDLTRLAFEFDQLNKGLRSLTDPPRESLSLVVSNAYNLLNTYQLARDRSERTAALVIETRSPLDHKKLLDFLIDQREEKYIELREGTRSYISSIDNHLKRLAIALEDDFKVQFYDPAFVRIRHAARAEPVTLGQVERTTVLMNNRAMAIVKPSATMEFDLPKRDIVIVEALNGAKALAEEYGALLNDPTFLAAFQLMGGAQQPAAVKSLLPSLGTSTDQQNLGLTSKPQGKSPSSLQALVPDPAIYKFETGTAFEIRPVIQPDGESIVYDFNYMYTTNVHEPVRADEKHLGRIKRHFVDTQVQTSSFEMREVSRYQVALKAARTSRGVPLFEDIPGLGVLFKPLPSAESSLQQNVILAQSTVYPTLFDLMGLRWAKEVVDLDHEGLRDLEHVVRGRNQTIEDFVLEKASKDVDEFLDISNSYREHSRSDLYRQQRRPSPYHPGGYVRPKIDDPTGHDFRRPDRRPPEMREEPRYDDRFRRPYVPEEIELAPDRSETPSSRQQESRPRADRYGSPPNLDEEATTAMPIRPRTNVSSSPYRADGRGRAELAPIINAPR